MPLPLGAHQRCVCSCTSYYVQILDKPLIPQSIFVGNDWPTGLLPIQLLAWQQKQFSSLGLQADQMQQLTSSSLALVPHGTSEHGSAAKSHPHEEAAVPAQLQVFRRLNQLPEASPDDPVWQDANRTLQEMLHTSLVEAKVRSTHQHCQPYYSQHPDLISLFARQLVSSTTCLKQQVSFIKLAIHCCLNCYQTVR